MALNQPYIAPQQQPQPPYITPQPQPQPPYITGQVPPSNVQYGAPYTAASPYNQQLPPPNAVIMPTQISWGENPTSMTCTTCHAQILTRVVYSSGTLTWLLCCGLCLFGCFFGCQFIPFCVDACKDVEHYCPNCNNLLGVHKQL